MGEGLHLAKGFPQAWHGVYSPFPSDTSFVTCWNLSVAMRVAQSCYSNPAVRSWILHPVLEQWMCILQVQTQFCDTTLRIMSWKCKGGTSIFQEMENSQRSSCSMPETMAHLQYSPQTVVRPLVKYQVRETASSGEKECLGNRGKKETNSHTI